jgi:hypothetical protein
MGDATEARLAYEEAYDCARAAGLDHPTASELGRRVLAKLRRGGAPTADRAVAEAQSLLAQLQAMAGARA